MSAPQVVVYVGEELGRYGFPHGHPFGPDRLQAFWNEARYQGLDERVERLEPRQADRAAIERFHTSAYVDRVTELSKIGQGLLDQGDTPAFPGCYEAASSVVGSTLDALAWLAAGEARGAFVPIAGLHHARRDRAGGFCIFNDCGAAIEAARAEHGLRRVAYVDIDAHHGDGVYYEFEEDPELFVVDFHEDGRFLYPGTGRAEEAGRGEAIGTKLNIPLLPGADDRSFDEIWPRAVELLEEARPELILLQCGADSVAGDPLTHLQLSPSVHAKVARSLLELAAKHASGRLLVMGGGGYDRDNLSTAWTGVLRAMIEHRE